MPFIPQTCTQTACGHSNVTLQLQVPWPRHPSLNVTLIGLFIPLSWQAATILHSDRVWAEHSMQTTFRLATCSLDAIDCPAVYVGMAMTCVGCQHVMKTCGLSKPCSCQRLRLGELLVSQEGRDSSPCNLHVKGIATHQDSNGGGKPLEVLSCPHTSLEPKLWLAVGSNCVIFTLMSRRLHGM